MKSQLSIYTSEVEVIEGELVDSNGQPNSPKLSLFKDKVVGLGALIVISGWLLLAVIDESVRPSFCNFASTFAAAYVGVHISEYARSRLN